MSRKNVVELLKKHSIDNLGTGNSEDRIMQLEERLGIQIPTEYRDFLKEVGYAEIFGDEIYSIYDDYDTPCLGIYQQNKNNKELKNGYLEFFSNDIDGTFYIKLETGEIRLNSTDNLFAKSFNEFVQKMIR